MKKRIIILGLVVLVVIVAWSGAWLFLSGLVKQNIEALADADGNTTPRIACETLNVGGYPFRFDADCVNAEIVSGDVTITVPGIRASIRVYAPNHALASALGPLELVDAFTGTRNTVAWSGLQASLNISDWRISRLSLVADKLVWSDTVLGETLIAQSPRAELHLMDIPEQHDSARHLAALAGYVSIKDLAYPGMTLTNTNAELQVELSGLPDDVRNWGEPTMLQAMQQAGGALKIVSIHGTDGPSTLDANGTISLDDKGMLDGQIAIKSIGVADRIGPFLQEPARTLVLGVPAADGSHSNLIAFRAGAVFSGLVPVAALSPLF
ncbi:hypothetical protein WH87_14810 [Devosia epidermidihirudinis]|uniref:DUF2125 domain-containing protein n=1 Tax=Devosia epidermidihirudinis TaxID=1293439 RepID=A0A0F5Q4I9_9HYPH|nr:DUF2125 domain-containing protein [Devosia epidermidihirudinis]KKC35843.1 hypothetical protein WH87_14810 [Devosia epidermidihirudinis]